MTLLAITADMPRLDGAACVGYPADWWFADEADGKGRETVGSKRQRLIDMRTALAVCDDCPALAACGAYCRTHPIQTKFGIWAAKTARQRGYDHRGQRDKRRTG